MSQFDDGSYGQSYGQGFYQSDYALDAEGMQAQQEQSQQRSQEFDPGSRQVQWGGNQAYYPPADPAAQSAPGYSYRQPGYSQEQGVWRGCSVVLIFIAVIAQVYSLQLYKWTLVLLPGIV